MSEHMALLGTYGANEIPKVRMQCELAPKVHTPDTALTRKGSGTWKPLNL